MAFRVQQVAGSTALYAAVQHAVTAMLCSWQGGALSAAAWYAAELDACCGLADSLIFHPYCCLGTQRNALSVS